MGSLADTEPGAEGWSVLIPTGVLLSGRYRIDSFIARGGMGEVYAAHDCVLGDRIALKTVTATSSGDVGSLAALRAEVTLSRKISHPNVCRMHDIGVHVTPSGPQLTFLTMEYIDGESLGARLLREGAVPEAEAVRLISGILAGLQAAHDAGVLHRDLKSDNVMLRNRPGNEPTPVIMDFGLASALNPNSSRVSGEQAMVGSLAYMAPEQVQGDSLRVVTDVYAVGVVFFEMLTGQLPFKASSPALAALKRLQEPAPRVRSIDPRISPELDRILAKALQHRPQDRYPSAWAMHQELLEFTGRGETGAPGDSGRAASGATLAEFGADEATLVTGRSPHSSGPVRLVRDAPADSVDRSLPVVAATAPPARSRRPRRMAGVVVLGTLIAAMLLVMVVIGGRPSAERPESSVSVSIGEGPGQASAPALGPSVVLGPKDKATSRDDALPGHGLPSHSGPSPASSASLGQAATSSPAATTPILPAPVSTQRSIVRKPPTVNTATQMNTATQVSTATQARQLQRPQAPGPGNTAQSAAIGGPVAPSTFSPPAALSPRPSGTSSELVYPPGAKRPGVLRPQ